MGQFVITGLQIKSYCECFVVKTKSQQRKASWARATGEIVQRSRLKEKKKRKKHTNHNLAEIHGAPAESQPLKRFYQVSAVPQGYRSQALVPCQSAALSYCRALPSPVRCTRNVPRTAGRDRWKSSCYCLSPALTFMCTFLGIKQKRASPLLSYIYVNTPTHTSLYVCILACRNYTYRHM